MDCPLFPFKMRPVTLYLTGVPQFVKLVDLSYNLDLLFDTNDIGTFELRDVSHYQGRRKIALDFSSSFDAFAAQSRLNRYVFVLPSGQDYMLNAKLAKKNMALRRVGNRWGSPSPVERAGRDWDANDAIAVLPTMSEVVLERAHAKLDAQLDLLKKQKQILKAQKKVLKAKKKLRQEYSKVDVASVEQPTSSSHNLLPRNPASKSKPRELRRSPVNSPVTPPIEKIEKKKPKCPHKNAKKTCKRQSRSRRRSRSKTRERSLSKRRHRSSSKNRRSSSKNRRSSSKNRRSRSRSRRSCSKSQRRSRSKNRWSSSKNRRPEARRSRSHYCRSRSRSLDARIRWRSRARDWPRSSDYIPLRARVRTLRSPEFNRNRSRSRDRVYPRTRHFMRKGSVSSSPSSERQLAIMPGPNHDSQSIIVKRKVSASPVIDYISNNTVINFHESSPRGMRYRCAADRVETVSKCTEVYDTNNIVIVPEKLTDTEKNKEAIIKENRVETSVATQKRQVISKRNEKEGDDVVEQDNLVLKKPLFEILLGLCKQSSLNMDPIGSSVKKDLASHLAGDVKNTVSSGYSDNETRISEIAIKEETNNDSYLNWQEISAMDTNVENVKAILDVDNIPEVTEINTEYPSQQMHHNVFSDDFSVDGDVKPIIDPEKTQLKEIPSLLNPLEFVVNEDSYTDEVVKPVTQLAGIPGVEIKKSPLLPKRPKFVIIIRHLMKEMGASIRKVNQDTVKMSFQCKFKYVLRVMLREIVLGKGRMKKSEIMRRFRDRYPRDQDDEFVRRVLEDIQAGKYGKLGPSDGELSDDLVGDDLVLVENKDQTIIISDSDDESEVPQTTNEQYSRRLAWAEWATARGLTPKKTFKVFPLNTMTPRVLIPHPTSMGPQPDKENTHPGVTGMKTENYDIVPEFTDTEVENLLKCMEKIEPGTADHRLPADPREGTETPHVTGITIMTSLSELFSLKYGKQVPTKEEKEIKIEHNSLTEEYMKDDAQYYNPYED